MNGFKFFIVSFLTIFNFCFSQIETEIYLNKYEFLEAEPIIFTIKFKNNSSQQDTTSIDFIESYDNYIKVSSENNVKILYRLFVGDRIGGPLPIIFSPNQETLKMCNLLDHFGTVKYKYHLNGAWLYFAEGKYSIKYEIIYYGLNVNASNEISFVVNKPQGIDTEACQKLMRAYEINDGNPWIMDSILLKRELYYEVAKNYPESTYLEEAIFRYNQETWYLEVDNLDFDLDKYFIEKFPDSYFMSTVLYTLSKGIYKFEGGEQAVFKYFKYIIENFSNFRACIEAKWVLENKIYLN